MFFASRLRQGTADVGRSALAFSFLLTLAGAGSAVADLAPSPIPECVGKPDGTFCKLDDGTAGRCETHKDTRRPGRTWQSCSKDEKECEHLAVGAECHGYLGKPAHCREFNDPEKKKTWRTCSADTDSAPAAQDAPAAPTEPAAPAASTPPAAAPPPPAKTGMFSCATTSGGVPGAPVGLPLLGLSLLILAARRRLLRAG